MIMQEICKQVVSVVVPVYNAQKYLNECVDSLLRQTYKNIEIILVDDGSTDESPKLCDSYLSDTRVRVYHRKNAGLSSSRQFGFEQSSGDFIMTIDADDYIAIDCIEKLQRNIVEANSDIACCCRYDFIGSNCNSVLLPESESNVIPTNKQFLSKELISLSNKVWLSDSWNKLYRKDFLRKAGVKFELPKRFNGNDLAFNFKLVLHCPSYSIINVPLLYHRLTPNSMVRRKNKPLQEGFEVIMEQLYQEAKKCGYDEGIYGQFNILYTTMLEMVLTDISRDSSSFTELNQKLAHMFERYELFKQKYNWIKLTPKGGGVKSIILNRLLVLESKLLIAILLKMKMIFKL